MKRWAFDPLRVADAALAALGVEDRDVQTLISLAHVAVSCDGPHERKWSK